MTTTATTAIAASPLALVVEDAPALRLMVAASLRQAGFEVVTLGEGQHAVETARRILPDLICLDIMLPDVCGIELCERIRGTPETSGTPILMTSARSMPQDRANAELAGATDYMVKPLTPVALVERARALVKHGRAR